MGIGADIQGDRIPQPYDFLWPVIICFCRIFEFDNVEVPSVLNSLNLRCFVYSIYNYEILG